VALGFNGIFGCHSLQIITIDAAAPSTPTAAKFV
jgi:hypothetical protein